jgi:hypothetical protein
MLGLRVRAVASGVIVTALVVGTATAAAGGGPVANGMLSEEDVGLAVDRPAHEAELIRASQVAPATCAEPETREYTGRVVSFGDARGPALTEHVLGLPSTAEADATFDEFRADDQATVDCGDTQFRKVVSLKSTPKGVGERRYTFVSRPTVGGKKVTVVSICVVRDSTLVLLVFQAWPRDKPPSAKIAKTALERLS